MSFSNYSREGQEGSNGALLLTSKDFLSEEMLSISEAAKLNRVTRQAIYVAIKQRKLKAHKRANRWFILLSDLEEYKKNKYSRAMSTYNGELIFDHKKGWYSIKQTAKFLNVPKQKIYYATRVGRLKASRRGSAWVVHIEDIKVYKNRCLTENTSEVV